MAIELDRLEVIISANLEQIEAQYQKIIPAIEKITGKTTEITKKNIGATEKEMSVAGGVKNVDKELNQLMKMVERQTQALEGIMEKSADNMSKGFSKGATKTRKTINDDVDKIVKDINLKMGRAKAEQERLAFLQAQRQDASSKGDTKKVISYDTQIARAEEAMHKYQSQAKKMSDSLKAEFKSIPQNITQISTEMDRNEAAIDRQKKRIKELTAEYEKQAIKVSNLSKGQLNDMAKRYGGTFDPRYQKEVEKAGYKFQDTKKSSKISEQIFKQQEAVQKAIAKQDALQKQYALTEDRAKQLEKIIGKLNTELGQSGVKTGNAAMGMKKLGNGADRSKSLFSKFGGVFNRTSNNIAHGTRRMNNGMGGFTQRLNRMIKQAFIFSVIYKGLMLVSRGFFNALKTNEEFSASLNQIKVNLMTAFYPIYTAVLPAINAMMRALAVVTGQIAHFTATLFGTTYTAAKQGASGLYQNVQAMNDSGNAADKNREKVKKLQRSLMGFDEINRIGLDDGSDEDIKLDGKPSVDFNTPIPEMPAWVGQANKILKDFFKPFQDSWAKHGKKVVDAWKYALREVNGLAKSIGKSFMEVWTNGSGERFISNILLLTASLLNLVGDVAKAFREAWDENERGTRLIQEMFNAMSSILDLAIAITEAFREAWKQNEIGKSIFGHLIEIVGDLFEIVDGLATGFKDAWKEAGLGQSILHTILKMLDGALDSLEKMSKATAEWSKKLDFTPLLESIDSLLKSIEPLTKNVFDGIAWFYNEILLPLASFTITKLIPEFFEMLGAALDVLNAILEVFKPLGKWLFDKFLKPIAEWTGGVIIDVIKGITRALKGVSDWITEHGEGFEKFVKIVGIFAGTLAVISGLSSVVGIVSGIGTAFAGIGGLAGLMTTITGAVGGFIALLGGPLALAIAGAVTVGVILYKNWDTIKEKAGELKDKVSEKWTNITDKTKDAWNNAKDKTKETWDNIGQKVSEKTLDAKKNVSEKWADIKTATSNNFEEAKRTTVNKFSEIYNNVKDKANDTKSKASTAWSNMKIDLAGYNENIRSNTSQAFDKVVGYATALGGRIGKGLTDGKDAVVNGAKAIANGIKGFPTKAINAVKNGVSWVLEKLGAGKNKLGPDYVVNNYEQGTGYHAGGLALVNDGYGANYQEAYQLPTGEQGLFPKKRNLLVDLPAGSSVLSGPRTASMLSGKVPRYAGGVGKWFSRKWDQVKEFTGDVWDYMKEPSKLVEAGISRFANLKGAVEPALSMSKGAIATSMDAATEYVKKKMEEFVDSSDADTSISGDMGVMQYLSNIARDVMAKFPGMRITSGYRHGDPYSHGKRQAVDIAYPAGMNGSSQYFEPANYAFNKFRDKVAYVITQGMVRDRSGMSGQGSSGVWTRWPDNDHYDHLHINGSIAQGQGGRKGYPTAGSGVERWRPTVARALRMTGQYSAGNVARTLYQMQTESGGNPNAINNWDINAMNGTPSKGLMQVIDPTFRAYAKAPYNKNIWDPLSNILASVRYAVARYGSLSAAYRGVGYENGGKVDQEGIYRLAEGNKEEWILPMEKPSIARRMVLEAMDFLNMSSDGFIMPELVTNSIEPVQYTRGASYNDAGGMNEFGEGIINAIMLALSSRENNTSDDKPIHVHLDIDGKEITEVVVKEHNKKTERQGYSDLLI